MPVVCAFTGCGLKTLRFPRDESSPAVAALKRVMGETIDDLIENRGVTRFISGLSTRTEIWVCEIVLKWMNRNPALELECLIPFLSQRERWLVANLSGTGIRYTGVIANYERIVRENKPDARYIKSIGGRTRNRYLVTECDFLLAVWNGEANNAGARVRMAREFGKPCIIIDPFQSVATSTPHPVEHE